MAISLDHIDRLVELAREQSRALEALAVRLDTFDRPVLEERRRIVKARRRETFKRTMGYYPEENQVLRRQIPPSGEQGKLAPPRRQPRKRVAKNF